MTPEGRVKKKLKAWLANRGAYQFWPVQTGLGAATVDCLVCAPGAFMIDGALQECGFFVGIECKREGVERMTKRQELVMKQMREAGAKTWLVTLDEAGELKWIEINE